MSWSPADDYDDDGNYVNPLRPRYKRNCSGCYCIFSRACETWPGDQYPDPDDEGDTDDQTTEEE